IALVLQGFENSSVVADKNMLELIIRNLITNAIKFSRQNTKVLVTCEVQERDVKLSVQDFGTGISEENLKKLKQGISFTTRGQANEGGTGLGLLLVRESIKKNGGTLSVQSTQGEGTTFSITIPKPELPQSIS